MCTNGWGQVLFGGNICQTVFDRLIFFVKHKFRPSMTVDGSPLVGLRGLACLHVMVRDILECFFLALARLTDGEGAIQIVKSPY